MNIFSRLALRFVVIAGGIVPFAASAKSSELMNTGLKSFIQLQLPQLGTNTPDVVAAKIVVALLNLLGIIALGLLIYGGFRWMTARGNEESAETARNTIRAAFIGLIIVLASYGIALYVIGTIKEATG